MDDGIALARHKLDVDDYHRMGDAGILHEDDRIELIDGALIDMGPISQSHAAAVTGLNRALVLACGDRAIVSPQNPVRLDRLNEPQPDFAIFRPRTDFYATGERPRPADILLLIEVADSSVRYDRSVKLPLYARAGIAEFWLIDLGRRVLEAYRDPIDDTYRSMTSRLPGQTLSLALAPDIAVTLDTAFF